MVGLLEVFSNQNAFMILQWVLSYKSRLRSSVCVPASSALELLLETSSDLFPLPNRSCPSDVAVRTPCLWQPLCPTWLLPIILSSCWTWASTPFVFGSQVHPSPNGLCSLIHVCGRKSHISQSDIPSNPFLGLSTLSISFTEFLFLERLVGEFAAKICVCVCAFRIYLLDF